MIVAPAAMVWPSLISSQPSIYNDTSFYLKYGAWIAQHVLHLDYDPAALPLTGVEAFGQPGQGPHAQLLARSPTYSLFLFLTVHGFGWIGHLLIVSGLTATAMALFLRSLGRPLSLGWAMALVVGLALLSSLPFVVTALLPDAYAGPGILAVVALVLGRRGQIGCAAVAIGLIAIALCFHPSNLLVLATTAGAAMLVAMLIPSATRRRRLASAVACLLAVAAAQGANAGLNRAVEAISGERLGSPPFLLARLYADGPGRAAAEEACARGESLVICRLAPLDAMTNDDFLWSTAHRGYGSLDHESKLRLKEQELGLVLRTVAASPVAVATTVALNASRQLARFKVAAEGGVQDIPPADDPTVAALTGGRCGAGKPCPAALSRAPLNPVLYAAFALSAAILAGLVAPVLVRRRLDDISAAVLVIGVAVLVNAVVMGAIAGVYDRYQARVAWLVPFAAIWLVGQRLGGRRAERT